MAFPNSKDYRRGTIPDWVLDETIPMDVRRDAVAYWNSQRRVWRCSMNRVYLIIFGFFVVLVGMRPDNELFLALSGGMLSVWHMAPIRSIKWDRDFVVEIPEAFRRHNWHFDGETLKPSAFGEHTK